MEIQTKWTKIQINFTFCDQKYHLIISGLDMCCPDTILNFISKLDKRLKYKYIRITSRMGSNPVRDKPLFSSARSFTLVVSRNGIESVSISYQLSTQSNQIRLNIITTKLQHKIDNRRINNNAFDLQEMKSLGQIFLYFHFYFLNLSTFNRWSFICYSPLCMAIFRNILRLQPNLTKLYNTISLLI